MGSRTLGALVVAAALTLPAASAGALPSRGVFVPGKSLGGIRLGDTRSDVLQVWGSRHGVCRDCRLVTWYFNLKPFEPQGAAVVFRRGRVIRAYTVWRPREWRTDEGLELGATSDALANAYPGLASRSCDRYTALHAPGRRSDHERLLRLPRAALGLRAHAPAAFSPACREVRLAHESESSGQVEQCGQGVVPVGVATLTIDQEGAHPEGHGALDVVCDRVADHHGLLGVDLEHLEHAAEDRRARLHLSVRARRDPRIDVEREVADEVVEVPAGVRDQADLEAVPSELSQGGQRVLVQLEVLRVLPALA